jgi:transposase
LKQLREISEASISSPRALAFISEASLRSAKAQPSATNKSHAVSASDVKMIEGKYQALEGRLDEATLRLWAAVEARGLGRGGVSMVAKALGISRTTIYAGLKELKSSGSRRSAEHGLASGAAIRRVRAQGGGRKRLTEKDTALLRDLDALLEPAAQEASWLPLRWTSKSTTRLARELAEQGHRVSQRSVCDLLSHLGYSLRAPCKAREGGMQLERNAQFRHIAILAAQFYVTGDPVIAVNVMRKELTGNFKKSNGKQYFKKKPEHAEIDDFNHSESGKKAPGEFRVATAYQGWVRAAIDHDTAEFLVECIRRWWNEVGRPSFPKARRLLLASSSSCSSGRGVRLWRGQLQKLAYDLNLIIQVCHLPPGTSKWNKIEDRKVHISNNSRGHSSLSHEVTIDLIGGTATAPGGRARPQLNEESFKAGAKTPDERISNPEIECNSSEQGWKYCIFP